MNHKQRIKEIVEEEFPGSTVAFEEQSVGTIRFTVYDAHGRPISKGVPHYPLAQIEEWSDIRLRFVIQRYCRNSD
jgi:hypothetical protein